MIIISGASSGIGQALYKSFKKGGYNVLGVGRRGPDIFKDVKDIDPNGTPITFEPVELLINCAGIMLFEENADVMNTNFWGTYNLIHNLVPNYMRTSCIINIASVSGIMNDAELPIYSASKAAIISLTKSLAKKWAPNTRVNCISPGFYRTNLVEGETPAELIKAVPLKYEEEPCELFAVVKMIWETQYMTGSNIVVDGGISC